MRYFIFLLIFPLLTNAQTNRFNKTYLLYTVQDSHSVLLYQNGYIVLGGSIDYTTDQKIKIITHLTQKTVILS